MRSICFETPRTTLVWMLLALAPLTAVAAPILGDPSLRGVPDSTRRLSEYEIVSNGDPTGLADPGTFDVSPAQRLGPYRREARSLLETNALFDPRGDAGGQNMFDSLRGFVNVAPGAGSRGPAARANNAPRNDVLDWVDLGPEARAWIHDSFKSIVDSALQLEVNERGRMSFSVLGFGDFGVAVSADRSQIAFTSNDEVLLTAQRGSDAAAAAASGSGGSYGGGGWTPGGSAPGSAGYGQSPLKKALELAFEIATHPLSMMVYLIIAAYILLWTVLNRQPHRRGHHASRVAHVHRAVTASGRSRRRHRSRRQRRS